MVNGPIARTIATTGAARGAEAEAVVEAEEAVEVAEIPSMNYSQPLL